VKQRDIYAQGRGFIRIAAIFRSEKRLTKEQERLLRERVRVFEEAPKKECPNGDCRAVLLASDENCPTCGSEAPKAKTKAPPPSSDLRASGLLTA
jgi:hypothetical protein